MGPRCTPHRTRTRPAVLGKPSAHTIDPPFKGSGRCPLSACAKSRERNTANQGESGREPGATQLPGGTGLRLHTRSGRRLPTALGRPIPLSTARERADCARSS